mgnify:CR=1 FL=1
MFGELYNEAIITFNMETESPLFIKASEDNSLNPASAENTYLAFYKDGELVPVIPGTSMKGVFRSSAEEFIRTSNLKVCDILDRYKCCGNIIKKEKIKEAKEKYQKSCPVCKTFGTTTMKSRVYFYDAFPEGQYKIGKRSSVAIDRITGASKKSALFDFEYVEYCNFKTQIKLKNFFPWQLKLIFILFERVDDGSITFGGLTSKGFGRIKINNVHLQLRYYNKAEIPQGYIQKDYYIYKNIEGLEVIKKLLEGIHIDNNTVKRCDIENEQAI